MAEQTRNRIYQHEDSDGTRCQLRTGPVREEQDRAEQDSAADPDQSAYESDPGSEQ